MKAINTTCPECGGTMHEGFLLDITYGASLPTSWVADPPERSIWTRTKGEGTMARANLSLRGVRVFEIVRAGEGRVTPFSESSCLDKQFVKRET